MLRRLKQAGLIGPTLAAAVALSMLLALGTWQVQRKQWKDGLVAAIEARVHAQPLDLTAGARLPADGDLQYLRVTVAGRFHHDKERYLYSPATAGLGWHVYTPLETPDGRYVWINRGFVPDARKDPASRTAGQVPGETRVTGLVRTIPAKGMFTPTNDVARNLWYWPELAAMSDSALPGAWAGGRVLPFAVDAEARPEPPGGLPQGGVTRLEIPNRHLEYAVTWYGLAATLIAVYLVFAAGRLKSARNQP